MKSYDEPQGASRGCRGCRGLLTFGGFPAVYQRFTGG